jgi:tetratricopeptide (TPR) repeat protein
MKIALPPLLILLALGGCAFAHDVNLKNASRYHDAALAAEHAGDFKLAERDYYRALVNYRDGQAPQSYISMELYNLGRMEGYACNYEAAKTHLEQALEMEERSSGPPSTLVTKRLFELARLSYDRGDYAAAIPYYGRGIPAIEKLGIEREDPIALADALDEYAAALRHEGQADAAAKAAAEAAAIRARHPGERARFAYVRYNQPCERTTGAPGPASSR